MTQSQLNRTVARVTGELTDRAAGGQPSWILPTGARQMTNSSWPSTRTNHELVVIQGHGTGSTSLGPNTCFFPNAGSSVPRGRYGSTPTIDTWRRP